MSFVLEAACFSQWSIPELPLICIYTGVTHRRLIALSDTDCVRLLSRVLSVCHDMFCTVIVINYRVLQRTVQLIYT